MLWPSRPLHAARPPRSGNVRSSIDDTALPDPVTTTLPPLSPTPLPGNPFECPIDRVLPPPDTGSCTTLRDLVRLLIDPAAEVEEVGLEVFAAMIPRRQLAALGQRTEWHDVVLGSERYQGYKDARALRLAGVTTVGKWRLESTRVPISAYSRGVLESAFAAMSSSGPQHTQEVMAWLSRTIQRALLEEWAATRSSETARVALPEPTTTTAPLHAASESTSAAPIESAPPQPVSDAVVTPTTTATTITTAQDDEEVEEIVEEVEEVEEGEEGDTPIATPSPPTKEQSTLIHLAGLMLRQFNSADGYLHHPTRELRAEESEGFVIAIDEDTAQVDPLALFSAVHAATPHVDDPIAVHALKQIWLAYNTHQLALESTGLDDAAIGFHREKSVEALLHGALLLRAISREDVTALRPPRTSPPYGFPLLSSDTRAFGVRRPRSSPHTDMTARRVQDAVVAYRDLFHSPGTRAEPLRPGIECNAGCGVVTVSGTTLHLYETSLKESVQEAQVRMHFAEAMLGVLHVLREKILTRINTVHYHILVTKLPASADDGDALSGTTIVSVDLTGPFTNHEKARLRALAEPLGLAREAGEFSCVEDIVMEIEESTRASVVHDLLQSRDDLEALLTPTLVQLLPDDDDDDAAAVEAEAESERRPSRRKTVSTTTDAEVEDDWSSEVQEAARMGTTSETSSAPRRGEMGGGKRAAVDTTSHTSTTAYEPHEEEEEEAEEEEEEEEEEETRAPAPARTRHGVAPREDAPTRVHADNDDVVQVRSRKPSPVTPRTARVAVPEDYYDEDEDEVTSTPDTTPRPPARRTTPVLNTTPARKPMTRHPPPSAPVASPVEDAKPETEYGRRITPITPPVSQPAVTVRRSAPRERPSAVPVPDVAEVTAAEPPAEAAATGEPAQEQWFKRRSKKRYFS